MIATALLQDFSQLLLKHGASLEDVIGMVYSKEELDPLTGKYKKYFDLTTVNRDPSKYPDGYSYKIRYKLDLSGIKIPQGKATYTTKTAAIDEAVKLGFDNRLEVLKNYEAGKDKPKGGKEFFKMLEDYYDEGSKYLLDDTANNKREVVYNERKKAITFVKSDLIPYLNEKKINSIQEFITPIYSGFKIYLQAKGVKDKTINNRLNYLIRIFNYHVRNGLLEKLPFTKGTALLRLTGRQEKEDAEVLPIEKLKGIYPHKNLIDPIKLINFMNPLMQPISLNALSVRECKAVFNDYILPFTLGILSLNTEMRNSEAGRIKREDFIGVPEKETFLLRLWNKKTEYFNKTNETKYRKIPLHAFTVQAVKICIQKKEELYGVVKDNDFLFGAAVADKDTGETDGVLHYRVFDKAVLLLLKLIKHKDNFSEIFFNLNELVIKMEDIKSIQEDVRELKEAGKGISFYSFRKTFRTMLGLNNDLAEYYMGHKLGDNSKTTYIQVNSLDSKLFVDEYAAPVMAMLDKFIFFSDEEMKKMDEKEKIKMKKHFDFMQEKITHGISIRDALIDYAIKEYQESMKTNANKVGDINYYAKI